MSRFVLTAQLQLQAPRNTRQVVNQMQQQLQNVNVQINPVINNQALSNANAQLTKVSASAQSVSKNLRGASRSAESFGSALGAAARRFASITLATGFFLGITRAMGSAVGRAVEFEKEMLKISQVTGKSVRGLQALSNEVTKLATTFGVSSEEILGAARTLSQAGLAADQVTKSLRILAQTDLAATFDNIADTTEGAVALINQFRKEVRAAGSEAKFLENALDAINAVSKNFAVESADLISVVRRTGGVFEAAGGQLNELIALFTSVRSTTRETADTIATGFRTIFTRIQRTETIDSLKELGIVLQDTTGKFVGPLEAVKRLSAGLAGLDPRDFRFNEIVEQLGGFRQIGKVIPLIKQYSTSVEALAVANNSMGSTAADAATAQQGLGNQFVQLKEKFDATVRSIADGDTFRSLAEGAIRLAESILRIVDALEPLMPMLTALAAFKLGQIAVPAFGRFAGVGGKNQGGRIHGFNKGGYVPGTGNRDTVPAMLTPGEFVIRKSSVNKIGASKLAKMNGYASGGTVGPKEFGAAILDKPGSLPSTNIGLTPFSGSKAAMLDRGSKTANTKFGYQPLTSRLDRMDGQYAGEPANRKPGAAGFLLSKQIAGSYKLERSGPGEVLKERMNEGLDLGLSSAVDESAGYVVKAMRAAGAELSIPEKISGTPVGQSLVQGINPGTRGSLFEDMLNSLVGRPFEVGADPNRPFDFLGGLGGMSQFFKNLDMQYIDAKKSVGAASPAAMMGKISNQLGMLNLHQVRADMQNPAIKIPDQVMPDTEDMSQQKLLASVREAQQTATFNKGGKADTVPAMLTPGEYVINKSAAQSIGYGNLNRMNKSGVAQFNKGGPVQFFANGGAAGGAAGGGMNIGTGVNTSMEALAKAATTLSYKLDTIGQSLTQVVDDFAALQGIDEKINGAATSLANTISSAVDDINILQSVDDKLLGAIQPLAGSIATAGTIVSEGVQNFAAGMSTIDETFKGQIESTVGAVKTAMADFAKGLTTIDDTLNKQFSIPAKAVEKAMSGLSKHLENFGKEILEKVKVFDTLSTPVAELASDLNKFAQSILARLDDLNPMSAGAILLGNALNQAGAVLVQAANNVASTLTVGATNVMKGMTVAIQGIGGSGNVFAQLTKPVADVAKTMVNVANRLTGTYSVLNGLNKAIVEMTKNLGNANITVNQVAMSASDTDQFFEKLEAAIMTAINNFSKAGQAAATGGAQAGSAGAGAARGGMMMGGGAAGGAMSNFANNAMMAAMAAGMLAQSMTGVNEETKAFIMDLSMVGGMLGMLAMSAAGGVTSIALATSTRYASIKSRIAAALADGKKVKAAGLAALADKMKAKTALAAGIAMGLIAAAATFVIMRMNHLGREAERLGDEFKDAMQGIREGGGDRSLDRLQAKARAALDMEAKARESMTGALVGAAYMAVAAFVTLALAPVTLGASLVIFGAAVAAGAVTGQQLAESMTTASQALNVGSDMLVASLYHSSIALGELSIASKQLELEQKEGVELLSRQNQIFSDFSANAQGAVAALSGFLEFESTAAGRGLSEEMDGSEFFGELRDMTVEAAKELQEAAFQQAQQLKTGIIGTIDEMKAQGATISEIFDNKTIQTGLDNYQSAVFMGLSIQMKLNGMMKREAKARLGLADVAEDQLTSAQRENIATQEAALIQEKAAKDSEEARKALKESQEARLKAEEEAQKAAEQKLKADIAIAQASAKAAQALDLFAVEMLGFGGSLDSVMVEFAALTGSVKQYKDQNEKLIASLTTGTVTPEAEAAAMATAKDFGIEAEVAGLMDRIKDTERIRKILTEKGMKEFAMNLNDTASELKIDEFLSDQGIDLSGLDEDVRNEIRKMFEDGLTDSEISAITDLINAENENQIKVLQELAKAQSQYLNALFQFGDAFVKARGDFIKASEALVNVQLKGAERIAQAQGREMTRGEVAGAEERRRRAPLQAAGLQGGGVGATTAQLERNRIKQQQLSARIKIKNDRGEAESAIHLQNEQKKLNQETALLRENLKKLSDQSALAAVVMGDIEKERGKRETVQGLIKEFTFASNQQRGEIDKNFVALQRVLATGNLNAIPDEMRGAVGGLLDRLKDVELAPGMTGGDISKRFEMQMANALKIRATGRPLTQEEMKKIYEATDKEQKLIDDLRAINAEEQAAAAALAQNQDQAMKDLIAAIHGLVAELQQAKNNAGAAAEAAIPKAKGGVIYASEGQPIFSPKGTDTVPAMLTPGEFVVNRKAASQNMGALNAINSGKVQYLNQGGPVTSWKNAPNGGLDQITKDERKAGMDLKRAVWEASDETNKFANSRISVGKLYGGGKQYFAAMGVHGDHFGQGWDDFMQRAGRYEDRVFKGFSGGKTFKNSLAENRIPLLVKALTTHDSSMVDATNARAGFSKVLPYLGTSEGWNMLPEVKMFVDGDWNYQKSSLTPGNGFFQRGWSTVSTSGGTYTRGAGAANAPQQSFSYDTAGLTEALESGTVVDYFGGPDANRVKYIGGVETINSIQNAFNDFQTAWGEGNIHPDWAYNEDGRLFYDAPSAGDYPEVPSAPMAQLFLDGNERAFSWMDRLPMAKMEATEEQFRGLFNAMLEGGYESELEQTIMAFANASNAVTKTPGFVGQALRSITSSEGEVARLMKALAGAETIEEIQPIAGDIAAEGRHKLGLAPALENYWSHGFKGIFMNELEGAEKFGFGVYGVNPFGDAGGGIWKKWFGMVKENLPPTGQGETDMNYLRKAGDWQAGAANFDVAEYVQPLIDEANALAGIDKDTKADAIDKMRSAVAGHIGNISSVIEGDNTGWAAEILGDAKFQQEQEEKDQEAKDQAAQQEAVRVQAKNLDVFYATNAKKAEAMEKVLKKDPTVAGAPWPVWRIPPYAKDSIDPEGVFNPKTEKHISPPFVVGALKRSGKNFDALFTYFKDMSFDLRGLAGAGYITGGGNDGTLIYDINRLAGNLPELGIDAEGNEVRQPGNLNNIGKLTKAALTKWSNSTADQWYPFDEEQMALIRIFFGKNLEKGLTNVQNNTRDAIADAAIMNPGVWEKEFRGGAPAWLAAAIKLRAGNQDNEGLGPVAGFATGGHVGGVHTKPKGTDTVPAILTPGEFVMRKSAVDKYGTGFMQRINSGKGSTGPYFQEGGGVTGAQNEEDKPKAKHFGLVDIAEWLHGNNSSKRRDAETMLGDVITVRLPADIGGMLNLIYSSTQKDVSPYIRNVAGPVQEYFQKARDNGQLPYPGYVYGYANLAEPSGWQATGRSYFDRSLFAQIFGFQAQGSYYPIFRDIYDENPAESRARGYELALSSDPTVLDSAQDMKHNEEGLVDLITQRRLLTLESASASAKFFSEVDSIFRAVSSAPTVEYTPAGYEVNELGELMKKDSGEDTGIYKRTRESLSKLGHRDKIYLWDFIGDDKFMHLGESFDYLSWKTSFMARLLPQADFERYAQARQNAMLNSRELGRKRLYEDEDATWEFNTGGSVPGRGNRDTVRAMLTPGEFVMRKSAVDKYGSGFMSSINSGLAYFANGGPVGFASSQFEKDGVGSVLEDMSHSLTSIDGSNQNILVGQRSLQRNQQVGFGAVEGGLGSIGPEIATRFDDLVSRLDGAFFNNFDGYNFNSGGGVPGAGNTDTVPAMLTPGEFVMRKSAVQKYGLGFMRAINSSGPSTRVGRGVQYKHEGDVMGAGGGFDFSGLSDSIGQLGSQVSTSLSAFESAFLGFSKLSRMLSDTINSIASLNITHTVNISGSLSIPGFSQQAINDIVKTISDQIADSTNGKVKRALNRFKRDQDNRT